MMSYTPNVNDYVIWNDKRLQGWVYFKDSAYITIETQVWPKDPEDLPNGTHHKNDRVLVLCYRNQWKELEYVKSRESVNDQAEKTRLEIMGKGTGREGIEVR